MKKTLVVCGLAVAGLLVMPSRAAADLTFFLGVSPTPEVRSARGFAVGVNLLIVGFEFDYANVAEEAGNAAPGLRTGMFNVLVLTPTTGVQLYATAGGGMFREYSFGETETSFGTNFGGGLKITLAGPLRLRLDYRVFNLRGSPVQKAPQRFYAGLNIAF
jgi:opacity protein-like surface antigen